MKKIPDSQAEVEPPTDTPDTAASPAESDSSAVLAALDAMYWGSWPMPSSAIH